MQMNKIKEHLVSSQFYSDNYQKDTYTPLLQDTNSRSPLRPSVYEDENNLMEMEKFNENSDSFVVNSDSNSNNRIEHCMYVAKNHLKMNMVLSFVIFLCLFISFDLFWYCESPSTVSKLPPQHTDNGNVTSFNDTWINNQTCYSLFTMRTQLSEDTEFISHNVNSKCPDMDLAFPERNKSCLARKVFIISAIGFLIIKSLGMIMYIFSIIKIYLWWFSIKLKWFRIKWEVCHNIAFLMLITSLIFWVLVSNVFLSLEGLQFGFILDIILIVMYRILSIHAKKYMNDLERYIMLSSEFKTI